MDNDLFYENENRPEKKVRHRKKQLYASIKKKMEFYFSDANLRRDRFMSQLVTEDKEVDLQTFLKFNQIHELTDNVQDIAKALRDSVLLKLTDCKTKVFRITPVLEKTNIDDCTVYVEQLLPDVSHDWLTDIFSKYGKVEYVSIPKYKHSKKVKGFAFVEYETAEGAKNAIEAFTQAGCCLTNQMNPQELCSINSFEDEKKFLTNTDDTAVAEQEPITAEQTDNQTVPDTNVNKRKFSETEGDEEEGERKKKLKSVGNEENVEQTESETDGKKKKKNRKKKKSRKQKYIRVVQSYGLQVLPKVEWKRLRNKYLNLQREKMKLLKQQLYKSTQQRQRTHDLRQQIKMKSGREEKPLKFELVPGLVVKVQLDEPLLDLQQVNKMKAEARCLENVAYVDVERGSEEAYIRFHNARSAETVSVSPSRPWENMIVITGKEEQSYWEKMKIDREMKLSNKIKVNKRGRTKLTNKAEKLMSKKIRLSVDE